VGRVSGRACPTLWSDGGSSWVLGFGAGSLRGAQRRRRCRAPDASENKFLKTCDVREEFREHVARPAAFLRRRARRGSAIDALVVASADRRPTLVAADKLNARR
jgi:hypothetical protein